MHIVRMALKNLEKITSHGNPSRNVRIAMTNDCINDLRAQKSRHAPVNGLCKDQSVSS